MSNMEPDRRFYALSLVGHVVFSELFKMKMSVKFKAGMMRK